MTYAERERIILLSIKKLEDKLFAMSHLEYDGIKSFEERKMESQSVAANLFWAYKALVAIREEKDAGAA